MTTIIKHRAQGRGLSLIELLVALAIGALLLGVLGNALGGIMATTRNALRENDEQEERVIAERIISHFLKNALPPNPGDSNTAFLGSSEEITFNASPPESLLPFGALRVHLYLDRETAGEISLFMDLASVARQENSRGLELKKHRLYRNVSTASFIFSDRTDTKTQNQDHWKDNKKLPSLISLAITRPAGKPPISITAMPRRNASGYCRFDQISFGCGF